MKQTPINKLAAELRTAMAKLEEVYSTDPEPDTWDKGYDDGIREALLQTRHVLDKYAPLPDPPSDAQLLYEAEDLSEKPWHEMTTGERSQYERMAAALRKRIEASK